MEGFLFANLLFFLFGIFLDLYLYLCRHKYRILVELFMNRIKGILYAAVSSSTFGLAPFFSSFYC